MSYQHPRPALIGFALAPSFVPGLERVLTELRARHPKATDAQLAEMIFVRGIVSALDEITDRQPVAQEAP